MRVWQASRQFVKDIYFITNLFPKEEKYCLVDQLRRAVISISSNIAEGCSRSSLKDQAHFINLHTAIQWKSSINYLLLMI